MKFRKALKKLQSGEARFIFIKGVRLHLDKDKPVNYLLNENNEGPYLDADMWLSDGWMVK